MIHADSWMRVKVKTEKPKVKLSGKGNKDRNGIELFSQTHRLIDHDISTSPKKSITAFSITQQTRRTI